MFDIGFSELLLFSVIALIVLGPEKLPQAARTAGQWYAKIRRTVSTLQSEIEAELDLAETRQLMQKELAKIRQTEADMRREMAEMRGSIREFETSQNQHLKSSHDSVDDTKPRQNSQGSGGNDDNRPLKPKAFDYAYASNRQNEESGSPEQSSAQSDNDSLKADFSDNANQVIQTITTRPWENMWFRLGAYDKARRLPQPPYLPNYKADILLNSHLDSSLPKQASVNEQESH